MTTPLVLFEGNRFRVERVTQTLPDGSRHEKQIVRHPGAVTLLPLLADGRICFVENYRASVQQTLIELPAGTREPGEEPLQTARRELAEEPATAPDASSRWPPSPCRRASSMNAWTSTWLPSCSPDQRRSDAGEDIRTLLCPWNAALAMVRDGRIRDAKSVAGLLYYHSF